jgi:hypothetical protein
MVLTTGEVGLIAVAATLAGVFTTLSIDRKRFVTNRRERWFNDRRDAYIDFVDSVNNIEHVCDSITALLLAGKKDKIPQKTIERYRLNAEAANRALAALRLIGSAQAASTAGEIVLLQKTILSLHPQFNKDSQPEEVDSNRVDKLSSDFRRSRHDFLQIARRELGVIEETEASPGQLPDTALVLAFRWVRRKIYESYVRSQTNTQE